MIQVGILSDTHGYYDERFAHYFAECGLILHAGDIGSIVLAERLNEIAPLKAVYGNIDGQDIRSCYPEYLSCTIEGVSVLMMHIGGYPGHYSAKGRELIEKLKPDLFISGHSHILKVQYDKRYNLLHVNPGAAGLSGWQPVRTLIRLEFDHSTMRNLEVVELHTPGKS